MTATTVIDASAVCAFLFGEAERDQIADTLATATIIAPAVLPFEVTNVCLTKIRQQPTHREDLVRAFAMFGRLPIEIRPVDWLGVLAVGERAKLSAYDASYLWLARRVGVPLLTLDRRLARAVDVS